VGDGAKRTLTEELMVESILRVTSGATFSQNIAIEVKAVEAQNGCPDLRPRDRISFVLKSIANQMVNKL
jgi:hypothetical protein